MVWKKFHESVFCSKYKLVYLLSLLPDLNLRTAPRGWHEGKRIAGKLHDPFERADGGRHKPTSFDSTPRNAGQHNLREERSPALFMFLKEVRVSECQTANDTKGKRSTTPRELGHSAKESKKRQRARWRSSLREVKSFNSDSERYCNLHAHEWRTSESIWGKTLRTVWWGEAEFICPLL